MYVTYKSKLPNKGNFQNNHIDGMDVYQVMQTVHIMSALIRWWTQHMKQVESEESTHFGVFPTAAFPDSP